MRRLLGRGLTAEELERVLRHYPGDIGAGGTRRLGYDKGERVNLRRLRWSLAIIAIIVEIAAFIGWRLWQRRRGR